MADNGNSQLTLGEIITNLPAVRAAKKINPQSRVHRRLVTPIEGDLDTQAKIAFQHSVFCQTSLPYRDPGQSVRLWQRSQGTTFLEVEAGRVYHPARGTTVEVGLPWGAKPRLILCHCNAELLRQGSPRIEIESSLTAFVKRIRHFDAGGRELRLFKDQLTRLSNSTFRFVIQTDGTPEQTNAHIIENFKLWPERDERQRVLWPTEIEFHQKYFDSLVEHAVPLPERDIAALAHNTRALDLYCWLAQRLHRVHPNKSAFITWAALKAQFGPDVGRMNRFKEKFRLALGQVRCRYKDAKVELDQRGMTLHHSPPPVAKRQVQLPPSGT